MCIHTRRIELCVASYFGLLETEVPVGGGAGYCQTPRHRSIEISFFNVPFSATLQLNHDYPFATGGGN